MKVELSSNVDKSEIENEIKHIEIVDNGDYILIAKHPKLKVLGSEGVKYISVFDVEYIEAYDSDVIVYTKCNKYISTLTLSAHLDYADYLIRISKSVIINKFKIEQIRPSINMKFKIVVNECNLEVNRTYYYAFKDAVGI